MSVLIEAGYSAGPFGGKDLPHGAIVAAGYLVAVEQIDDSDAIDSSGWWKIIGGQRLHWPPTSQERAFGDYRAGRYAWLFVDMRRFAQPIPAKGALRLWRPDAELERAIRAAMESEVVR